MKLRASIFRRKVAELESVLEGVHNVKRQRPLLIRMLNEERRQVQEPIYIEGDRNTRVHELDVTKPGEDHPRTWTRILSETKIGVSAIFEGSVDGNTYPGSKYAYLSRYERIQTLVLIGLFVAYTSALVWLIVGNGEGELTPDVVWRSGWFPLACGLMFPQIGFLIHIRSDVSLDILELVVEDRATDSRDHQGYYCRLASKTMDTLLQLSGIEAPEDHYKHVDASLGEVGKMSALEYREMNISIMHMKSEIQTYKNDKARRDNLSFSSERAQRNIATALRLAQLIIVGVVLLFGWKYAIDGGMFDSNEVKEIMAVVFK